MHELGVVFHIADQITEVARENNVKKLYGVTLALGEVSTVIPDELMDVWNWNRKKTELLNECELKIEKIDAVSFCEDCEKEYPTVKYGRNCPYCGGGDTYLVTGNEVILKEVVAEKSEASSEEAKSDDAPIASDYVSADGMEMVD